jgi:hypothetical protein
MAISFSLSNDNPNTAIPSAEVEGTFGVNGSAKRIRELQSVFETPPKVHLPSPTLFSFSSILNLRSSC